MIDDVVHLPNGVQIRLTLEDVGVTPGLGKHRLYVQTRLAPASNEADGAALVITGDVSVENLAGGGGYVGQIIPTVPETIRRDIPRQIMLTSELSDQQIRGIEATRTAPDGSFNLRLALRVSTTDGAEVLSGSVSAQPVRISRETWLKILEQIGFRKTLIIELPVPEAATKPELTSALKFYQQAQSRFGAGDFRGTAESLRQCLAAIVGKKGEEEQDAVAVLAELRAAQKRTRSDRVEYTERLELVRASMKFAADLGAHPEVADTFRMDALAQLHMTAGLIQWFVQG